MLSFFTIILTIVLVLDCLILGLLILIQLPKKEAGVGVAFGGGATDALFGAGSGNALTKLTKYTATAFFILVIILQIMKVSQEGSSSSATRRAFDKLMNSQSAPAMPPAAPNAETAAPAATNAPIMQFNLTSNAAPAASTNAPSAPAK
jgi:preprotein translocase subunit SecG